MARKITGWKYRLRLRAAVAVAGVILFGVPAAGRAQTFLDFTGHASPYRLFLPSHLDAAQSVPLVVMLHGCDQDSQGFADVTGMNAIAEQHHFVVVYPEQTAPAQPSRCWNWYKPADQARGDGEPKAIVNVVKAVKKRHDVAIDGSRIYVAGLSAGASMAVILGATYPDVFAAVGAVAGVPYKAADSCFGAWNAMERISDRMLTSDALGASGDYMQAYWGCWFAGEGSWSAVLPAIPGPDTLGQLAFEAMAGHHRVVPLIVFQGLADNIVVPQNGADMVSQWAQADDLADDGTDNDDIDDVPDAETAKSVPGGHEFIERTYRDASGETVIESYLITGMGHAWPGGAADMKYSDPAGPDASALIWAFFEAHPGR